MESDGSLARGHFTASPVPNRRIVSTAVLYAYSNSSAVYFVTAERRRDTLHDNLLIPKTAPRTRGGESSSISQCIFAPVVLTRDLRDAFLESLVRCLFTVSGFILMSGRSGCSSAIQMVQESRT